MKKPVALEFQQGQQAALTRDASFTRSSLANEVSANNSVLGTLQQNKQALQQSLQAQMQNGQFNVNTAIQLQQIQRQQQQEALKYRNDYGITTPFFNAGGVVYDSNNNPISNPAEFFQKAGVASFDEARAKGLLSDASNLTVAQQLDKANQDRAFGLQEKQFNQSVLDSNRNYALQAQQAKQGSYSVTQDAEGNPVAFNNKTGEFVSVNSPSISQTYADGTTGGQCGDFAHNLADFPSVGNSLGQKQATVNKSGVSADQWREQGANIGDVLIQNYGTYGHVSVVTAVNGDGTVTVKESNFNNDGKVGTRTISMNDSKIYGVLRGTLKDKFTSAIQNNSTSSTVQAYAAQYASTGTIPTGMPKGLFSKVAQAAKELPQETGTVVDRNTGVKSSKLAAGASDDISRLYNITKLTEQLKELDKKRIGGLVGGVLGKVTGSDDQSKYLTIRKAIVDEMSRMQSGAALTAGEIAQYEDYLPGRFSESLFLGQDSGKKIENFTSYMNDKLGSVIKTNGLAIYGYSPVQVNGKTYKVGDIIDNGKQKARVNADGSLTLVQ